MNIECINQSLLSNVSRGTVHWNLAGVLFCCGAICIYICVCVCSFMWSITGWILSYFLQENLILHIWVWVRVAIHFSLLHLLVSPCLSLSLSLLPPCARNRRSGADGFCQVVVCSSVYQLQAALFLKAESHFSCFFFSFMLVYFPSFSL